MRLVVATCGARKRGYRTTAADLYTGPYARACIAWAQRTPADARLILSSRYGLVRLDQELDPYETTWRSPDAISAWRLRGQAEVLGVIDADVVTLAGGREYLARLRGIWPHATQAFDGPMGVQLAAMAADARAA